MEIIPYIAIILILLLCLLPKTNIPTSDYEVNGDPQDYQTGTKSSFDNYEVNGDPQDY